jgi:hypothetical protein
MVVVAREIPYRIDDRAWVAALDVVTAVLDEHVASAGKVRGDTVLQRHRLRSLVRCFPHAPHEHVRRIQVAALQFAAQLGDDAGGIARRNRRVAVEVTVRL